MEYFQKFKDIKGEEKAEQNLEKQVALTMKDLPAQNILQRIIKGEEFTIALTTKNREECIDGDPKRKKPELEKFENTLERLGYKGGYGIWSREHSELVYRPAPFYPENLIVKFAQDNYDKLMEGIFEREKNRLQMHDAYLFMALVKNKKEPVTREEKQYFNKIWEKLELPGARYSLAKPLIDDINKLEEEKEWSLKFLPHDRVLSENDDCKIRFSRLEADVEKRAKAILELIQTDPLGTDDCCAKQLTNSGQFVEDGWFAILDGATKHHGRWYCLERDPLVHYFVLENLDGKFGMPREYVKEQMANITSKNDHIRSPAKLAGIINRAYRIESGRKPLEL